ncbi:MAG: RlmE family RNA methyltransferase [Candidatus Bathyarchaeia archaeon]
MSNAWVRERKNDFYYKKAKEENLRSRASYKLFQAVTKYQFIKPGNLIVDLGAAPGGWTQAARQLVEDTGFVYAVDIKPMQSFEETNVQTLIGDITDPKTSQTILAAIPRPADTVISDAAPNVSGIWDLDHARQIDLASNSLQIATDVLRPGGSFFVKVFQGNMLNGFAEKVNENFGFVKLLKPKASRSKSAELYILGMKYKPRKI